MYNTIDSVKRAARKNGKAALSGYPTSAGTIYIPGYDGKNRYLKYQKMEG